MIDTDKYEPTWMDWILHNTREHSSDGWREMSKSLIELSDDDRELIANAPILRAEVFRLREALVTVQRSLIWDEEDRTMDGDPITLEALVAQVEQVRNDITEMIE